ncbi:MAG TPA: response regulator [Longimicrobiales bacterium]|jgi:DNA-binding response OmpR family regulator|nr:response regulator [Longimicrobiales bacterium]
MDPAESVRVRRILVVDDEPHVGRIIQFKLEQGPYDVLLSHDGIAALDILRREDPIDLVLLDIMLPRLGGLELLAQLRRLPHRRDTPVIMLTAKGNETDRTQAEALGADDFVVKPFSPKRLYARINEICGV